MSAAIYNSGIPDTNVNTVKAASRAAFIHSLRLFLLTVTLALGAVAYDWNAPEQQLARKIAAATGPGAVSVTFDNRSSLRRRDCDIIQNGLRNVLESLGVRFVSAEQAAATVAITFSENRSSYVWVAEIRQGAGQSAVMVVSSPRAEGTTVTGDAVPLSIRKTSLWTQHSPILDVAVLEESAGPTHIAVLDADKVSIYRQQNGKWQLEQALAITHPYPFPRDLRGRLIPGKDHLLDAFLPGVICRSSSGIPLALVCRESDDPWPLVPGGLNSGGAPARGAFFAGKRNFFTGALSPAVGKFSAVPKFYSAAFLPRDKYSLWLFASGDGQVHLVDGVSDQVAKVGWGSDITSVKTVCGAGWQVLATDSTAATNDSVRAYEFPDRDPVPVSPSIDLPGHLTGLWTEAKGDSAIAIVRNRETGSYEAFRLALACSE